MIRRRNKPIALFVGFGAVGVFTIFVFLRLQAKNEVAQLISGLSGDNPADVAWAFEKLKAVEDSHLWHLLPHIESNARTTLKHMARSDRHYNGVRSGPREPDVYLVGQVVLFLLSTRLTGELDIRDTDRQAWAAALKEHRLRSGTLVERVEDLFRWPKQVLLPSSDPTSKLRMPTEDGVTGLLSVLTGQDHAEAAWAFEALRTLSDDRVDALLDSVMSREHVLLDSLHWDWGTGSVSIGLPRGCTLGQVVRYLLCTRIGLYGTHRLIPHELWRRSVVSPEEASKLIERWKAHVAAAPSG